MTALGSKPETQMKRLRDPSAFRGRGKRFLSETQLTHPTLI